MKERYLKEFDLIVKSDGTVWRICPQSSHGKKKGEIYQLSFLKDRKGYLFVSYTIGGKTRHAYIHRLVAFAFIENPCGYKEVDHIDRNPLNNNVTNLRWASRKMQCDNSSKVLNRKDYGVRKCEDRNAYNRARYSARRKKEAA